MQATIAARAPSATGVATPTVNDGTSATGAADHCGPVVGLDIRAHQPDAAASAAAAATHGLMSTAGCITVFTCLA